MHGGTTRTAAINIDRLCRAAFVFVSAAMVLVVGGLTMFYATRRAPWHDELATLWFVERPGSFLARYHGDADPHPFGYYLPALVTAQVSQGWGWLRLGTLTIATGWVLALSALTVGRAVWTRLWLIVPAAIGCQVFVMWGFDFRMYGTLAIAAAVLAVTGWMWAESPSFTPRHLAAFSALIVSVALLHVWGTVLAAVYTGLAVGVVLRHRSKLTRSSWWTIGGGATLAALVVGFSYQQGPLGRADTTEQVSPFTLSMFSEWLRDGLSTSVVILVVIVALWVASLIIGDRSTLLWFDLPAITVVGVVLVVSPWLQIAKPYSVTPAVVLLIAGTVQRLWAASPPLAFVLAVVLFFNTLPTAVNDVEYERQAWGYTTRELIAQAGDTDCPVLVYPTGDRVEMSRQMLGDRYTLLPFDADGVAAAAEVCDSGWIYANHTGAMRYADAEALGLSEVTYSVPYLGFVGRYDFND